MNFRDHVESVRPVMVSVEEKRQQINQIISNIVLSVAKENIIEQAKHCPKDGKPLNFTGMVYLGTFDDELMSVVVCNETHEEKSFFSFLTSNKTWHTKFTISPNGVELLKTMQTTAKVDGIDIIGYCIGFGDHARTDNEDSNVVVGGKTFTKLHGAHIHSFPVEMRHTDREFLTYLLSPETNGRFYGYSNHSIAGLFVKYAYIG